jgi:hypothetical protein
MGDAVLAMMEREALRQAREWHDQFPPMPVWPITDNPLGCIGHCDPKVIEDEPCNESDTLP